jgi:hypothetical protein
MGQDRKLLVKNREQPAGRVFEGFNLPDKILQSM